MLTALIIIAYLSVSTLSFLALLFYLGVSLEEKDYEQRWGEFCNGSSNYDSYKTVGFFLCLFWPMGLISFAGFYLAILSMNIIDYLSELADKVTEHAKSLKNNKEEP